MGKATIGRRVSAVLLALTAFLVSSGRPGLGVASGDQDPPPSPPSASPAPDNLDFGNQVVGRTSAAKRITVKNVGGKPLYFDSVNLSGDNPNSFAVLKDTCTGAAIDPDRACIVDVTFTPSGTGGRNARVRFDNNAPDSPQRVRLKGNGINSIDVAPF